MLIAVDGGGGSSTPPAPSAPPSRPPVAACTLRGDSVTQSAPSQHSSLFGSLWHAASSGASSMWHAASPTVAPVERLGHGAYDVLLKPDIDGVLEHQQAAKDILTTLMPGPGQVVSTALGTAQDYFGSKSPTQGSVLASLRASSIVNAPAAAAERLVSHPETTVTTGFHLAMLASWFVPGAGEAADAAVHGVVGVVEHAGPKIEPAGRVFWSGGTRAAEAATTFAEKHALETIAMSDVGKTAERAAADLTEKLNAQGLEPWTNGVRDIWVRASTDFAEHAEGVAHVFLRENERLEESIWARVERPILEKSEKIAEIVKHDVF